jgi:hypothetical protein
VRPEVDFAMLVPCGELSGEDPEDEALLRELVQRAYAYLDSCESCGGVRECFMGDIAVGGVVAVMLFRIDPVRDADEWLWVVVGDLPPACVGIGSAADAAGALRSYVREMRRWVTAVKNREPVEGLGPVLTSAGARPVEPSPALAGQLESRLDFLEKEILVRDPAVGQQDRSGSN